MSVKIWCEECKGSGCANKRIPDYSGSGNGKGTLVIINNGICSACHGLGYEERGCGNCNNQGRCPIQTAIMVQGNAGKEEPLIDYCSKWEAK